jgi:hypothetical protein
MGACCSAKSPDLIHDGPEDHPHTTPWLRLAIGLAISGLTMTFSLGVNLSPLLIPSVISFTGCSR